MKTKLIIFASILFVLAITAFKLENNRKAVEAKVYHPDTEKAIVVETDTVSMESFQRTFTYTGTFMPKREAMIIPMMAGQVEGIYFEEGDQVNPGKLLVKLDDDLLQAQHIGAEANYQTAQRTTARYESVVESGGVSGLQVDNSKLNLKSTESQLKQLNKQISYTRITAPFGGTITMKDVEMGSVIGNAPIARITDVSELKLELAIPESEISYCKEGVHINIETTLFPGKIFKGKIEYVSDRADQAHNYLVRVLVPNNNKSCKLKAGMYGKASFSNEISTNALSMSRTALVGSMKAPQVYVIRNGQAMLQDITIGQANEETIEVLNGLNEGDIIVTSGHINLTNGSNVQVTDKV